MAKAKKETVEKFNDWLRGMALRLPVVAWSPSHTQIACQFAEELLRQDHKEIRYRVLRDHEGDVMHSGDAQEDE